MSTLIRWDKDADGIVTLTMDDPGQSANTMHEAWQSELYAVIDRLAAEQAGLAGVVITSAKTTFLAGADLHQLLTAGPEQAMPLTAMFTRMKTALRTLETLDIPVVAALNGTALGGGYELALACHHRILLERAGTVVGLPEVGLGLLPGGGGIVRTVRMFGLQKALTQLLLHGQKYRPTEALALGLVDAIVATPEALTASAKAWIKANPNPNQPWDQPTYRIPGGTPSTPAMAAILPALSANLRKQLKGQPLPAPRAILAAAVESSQVDLDTAMAIETRYVVELIIGQVSKNMIKGCFLDPQAIAKGSSRPDGYPVIRFAKVAVIGAGMMGAGIAYVSARAGMQVILKDVTLEAAEKGKAYSAKLLDKAVARGQLTGAKRDAVLALITPTDDYADCEGCDLVVEAVFESPELKKQVFAELEKFVAPDALLGSNTSTLPITDLAAGVTRPDEFIGLHFFSPVDKMQLVEIVVGEKTSDAAIAKAIDYTLAIKKTPIVVNDSRGFFTSRVIGAFVDEAMAMLGEGVEPASIEQAASQAGYPAPPLRLMDELTLSLPLKIRDETKAGYAADGREFVENGAGSVLERLVREFDRPGRSSGAGFYDYENGQRTLLWPGLRQAFNSGSTQLPFEDMHDRMLFAEALDTVRCFDEGVLRTVADANVGSLLGIGFPAWTGGVCQFIDGYPGGVAGFIARAGELAERYGQRFTPPQSLIERAAEEAAA